MYAQGAHTPFLWVSQTSLGDQSCAYPTLRDWPNPTWTSDDSLHALPCFCPITGEAG